MADRKDHEETFSRDISRHELTIIKNEGLYRHLRCRRPGTGCMGFDIITWPGYLAYCGDMGDFMFTRIDDMFEFFRNDKQRINPGYWSEKCVAADKSDGIEKFSVDKFNEAVLYEARQDLDLEDDEPIPEDAKEELFELLSAEDEWDCVARVRDFSSSRFNFCDFFEHDCKEYSTRFLWCLSAIVWAIAKFDEQTKDKP